MLALLFGQPDGGAGGPIGTVIMLGSFVAIFYFLLIRPQRQQQKRHDEMVTSLKRGDEVVTVGGVVGRIVHVKEDRLTIKTGEDTRLVIERDKIGRKISTATQEE